jgi:hypothetical protein
VRTAIEIRAFRGSRRSSVYRACVVPEPAVERMRRVAGRQGLSGLASVLAPPDGDLPKETARRVAADANALRLSGELLDVDDELLEVADVASWCSRAPDGAWLSARALSI